MKEKGFILVTSLLVVFMMLAVFSFVQVKTLSHVKTSQYSGKQMESVALAEQGTARAAKLISTGDINTVLAGSDREDFQSNSSPSLNPIDPFIARTAEISSLEALCGQGTYYFTPGAGKAAFFKVSNNSGELPLHDVDGKVVVRSMGIIRNTLLESETSLIKNQVTILESTFRKDRPFVLPAPLVMLAPAASCCFEGNGFQISGGELSSVFLLASDNTDREEIMLSIQASLPAECLNFPGPAIASAEDAAGYANLALLSSPDFWQHFRLHVDEFGLNPGNSDSNGNSPGIFLLPDGNSFSGALSGILITRGDVELGGTFSLDGLLIHLGEGKLVLDGSSRVNGGVMYIPADCGRSSVLEIGGRSRITYDPGAIRISQDCLPLTHLGTRFISE